MARPHVVTAAVKQLTSNSLSALRRINVPDVSSVPLDPLLRVLRHRKPKIVPPHFVSRLPDVANPWRLLGVVAKPWRWLDETVDERGGPRPRKCSEYEARSVRELSPPLSHHEWLDLSLSRLRSGRLTPRFYPDGWGRTLILPEFARQLTATRAVASAVAAAAGARINALSTPVPTATSLMPPALEPVPTVDELPPQLRSLVRDGLLHEDTAAAADTIVSRIPLLLPQLSLSNSHTRPYARVLHGSVPSPDFYPGHAVIGLAQESRTLTFQLVLPTAWQTQHAGGMTQAHMQPATQTHTAAAADLTRMCAARPCLILLPGTGEQGFTRRRECVAYPLAQRGIATLIVESPYYGSRQPAGQVGSKLRSLVDLCVQGRVTIEEARALGQWICNVTTAELPLLKHDHGHIRHTLRELTHAAPAFGCVLYGGISMGGLHAAMAASLSPFPVGVASWCGPPSASPVYTIGALAPSVHWDILATQLTAPGSTIASDVACMEAVLDAACESSHSHTNELVSTSTHQLMSSNSNASGTRSAASSHQVAAARDTVARLLRITDLTSFVPPRVPSACVFTHATHDLYVPHVRAVADMWQAIQRTWVGCDVRAVPGGHVSASLFQLQQFAQTVTDVVDRLTAARASDGARPIGTHVQRQ